MKLLAIECIGDNYKAQSDLWTQIINSALPGIGNLVVGKYPTRFFVAEILGTDPKWKFKRKFLPFKKDYSKCNGNGSRGVYAYFFLVNGKIYDIKSPKSWKREDRYYCRIEENKEIRMTEDEVSKWLNNI